jgi:4-hydroxy-tetrahydrodipicolinate reductase
MHKIFISGITGRVGRLIVLEILDNDFFHLIGGSCNLNNEFLGKDIGDLINRKKIDIQISHGTPLEKQIDIIIDFSSPESSMLVLEDARSRKIPILIGTTGFNESQLKEINKISSEIPVLLAPNTSSGIAVLKTIITNSRALFSEDSIIEIEETHHEEKKDSPSGTALDLKETISNHFPNSEITVESFREGTNPGEHTIRVKLANESIELTHKAEDRSIFASGALIGARWLLSRPKGLYRMHDIYSS